MNKRPVMSEEEAEHHRSLLRILKYLEKECGQAGYSGTRRLLAISLDTLKSEVADRPLPKGVWQGRHWLH